jgi:hypothetical protein
MQHLSKKFYKDHVPNTMRMIPKHLSKFLSFAEWCAIINILPNYCHYTKLYSATESEFAAKDFHEQCDNLGATLTICKSEHDHIFGFFTHVPWTSIEQWIKDEKGAFVFRMVSPQKVVKLMLQTSQKGVRHRADRLAQFYDFGITDKANNGQSCWSDTSSSTYYESETSE